MMQRPPPVLPDSGAWSADITRHPATLSSDPRAASAAGLLVTVGILAHNEERRLGATIASLFAQSILTGNTVESSLRLEIVVVPNGCTDATAAIAERALAEAKTASSRIEVGYKVVSLSRPGKSAAWNELIHEIADPATDIFVMMDADIEFVTTHTIENSIAQLLVSRQGDVVVDLPVNDLVRKAHPNLLERALVQLSAQRLERPPGLAGSFYCARGDTLRAIWMPRGLPGEDGFLAAAITTDGFRVAPDSSRIRRAADAAHYYEGLNSVRAIIRHEVRLVIGTAVNVYLCWDVLHFLTDPRGLGAGDLIRRLNQERPTWFEGLVANAIANRGLWALPRGMFRERVWSRFGILSRRPVWRVLHLVPFLLGAFVIELIVLHAANRQLRRGKAIHYW
ncbi:glycosyltransferase family 2 protein [Rhodovastum atsumiense]|uniref:Glycosyltransferase family 2 protein n=1 Tax=Rhodovastum atsumiense TaxID=504468 RepID=A0A5M6J0F6_9PROT|nr:glycosyltransferase family 2 protein [Rhodovastum atsumiense]KAA5614043.1 glycosyltransferase family 2 protein [Rhodovastum atsumiense]